MIEFISYALKTILSLGVFALVYRFGFIQDINFRSRRLFLLSSVFFSFIIPLLSSSFTLFSVTSPGPVNYFVLEEIRVYSSGLKEIEESSRIPFSQIAIYLYFTIASILLIRIVYQVIRIIIKAGKYSSRIEGNLKIYRLPLENVSFSFFNSIFIGKTSDEEDLNKILAHEKVHAGQYHTLDVLIMEILTVMFWYNPLIWWFRNELKNVHEYLADEGALNQGFNRKSYQITLLEHLIGSASYQITNNFNYSLIKNRIAMMNIEKKDRKKAWKVLWILPVSILLLIGFACTEKSDDANITEGQKKSEAYYEPAFMEVDVMPEYPGGFDALRKHIALNLKYPEQAKINGIEGKVMVQFIVDKEGNIVTGSKEYKLEKEGTLMDEVVVVAYLPGENTGEPENKEKYIQLLKDEAVRVVSSLPAFESPALKDGKPVAVAFTFPINFLLQ